MSNSVPRQCTSSGKAPDHHYCCHHQHYYCCHHHCCHRCCCRRRFSPVCFSIASPQGPCSLLMLAWALAKPPWFCRQHTLVQLVQSQPTALPLMPLSLQGVVNCLAGRMIGLPGIAGTGGPNGDGVRLGQTQQAHYTPGTAAAFSNHVQQTAFNFTTPAMSAGNTFEQ